LLIDADRLDDGSGRSGEAIRLAEAQGLLLIRQVPCIEGVLLRLHRGHNTDNLKSSKEAERQLCELWPGYRKPITRHQLAARFGFADLRRLAEVDAEIRRLTEILGLAQPR
jgi:hypothetical protein